jgi:hypothetical protein
MADGLGFDAEFGQAGEQIFLGCGHSRDITPAGDRRSRAGMVMTDTNNDPCKPKFFP